MQAFYFLVKVLAGNQREPEIIADTDSINAVEVGEKHLYHNVRSISIEQIMTDQDYVLEQTLNDKPLSSQLRNRFGFTYNSGHWERIFNGVKHKQLGFTVLFHADDHNESERFMWESAERQNAYLMDMNRVDAMCNDLMTILKK